MSVARYKDSAGSYLVERFFLVTKLQKIRVGNLLVTTELPLLQSIPAGILIESTLHLRQFLNNTIQIFITHVMRNAKYKSSIPRSAPSLHTEVRYCHCRCSPWYCDKKEIVATDEESYDAVHQQECRDWYVALQTPGRH
jgi:hypothetical protein